MPRLNGQVGLVDQLEQPRKEETQLVRYLGDERISALFYHQSHL